MHDSAMRFVRAAWTEAKKILPEPKYRYVLEVGSLDINGSARTVIEPEVYSYFGIDLGPGPGVDEVRSYLDFITNRKHWIDKYDFGVDLIVSTEALEHDPQWEDTAGSFWQMLGNKGGPGALILTWALPGRPVHHDGNSNHYNPDLTVERVLTAVDGWEWTFLRGYTLEEETGGIFGYTTTEDVSHVAHPDLSKT